MAVMIWNGLLTLQHWFLLAFKGFMCIICASAVIGITIGMIFRALYPEDRKAKAGTPKV